MSQLIAKPLDGHSRLLDQLRPELASCPQDELSLFNVLEPYLDNITRDNFLDIIDYLDSREVREEKSMPPCRNVCENGQLIQKGHQYAICLRDKQPEGCDKDSFYLRFLEKVCRFARHLKQEYDKTSENCFLCTAQPCTCRALDFVSLSLIKQRENDIYHSSMVIGVVDMHFDSSWSYFFDPALGALQRAWSGGGLPSNRKVILHKFFNRENLSKTIAYDHGNICAAVASGNYIIADYFGIMKGTV